MRHRATQLRDRITATLPTEALMATVVVAAILITWPAVAASMGAGTTLKNKDGESVGSVEIAPTASGVVHITIEADGLPAGTHGFHIHETGQCDAADGFKSASGHLAGGREHGVMAAGGPHPGDLPNIHVPENGKLTDEVFLTPPEGNAEDWMAMVMDEDGSAVMIHDGADDYQSQPSGDAGSRIACGVIEKM